MKKSAMVIFAVVILIAGIITGSVATVLFSKIKGQLSYKIDSTLKTEKPLAGGDSEFIGEDEARKIALDFDMLNESDVIFEKVKLEKEDGIWHYEIEFRYGRTEYDFDIDAVTGKILSHDIDLGVK